MTELGAGLEYDLGDLIILHIVYFYSWRGVYGSDKECRHGEKWRDCAWYRAWLDTHQGGVGGF